MQSLWNTAGMKRTGCYILIAGMGIFVLDALLVIFSGGVQVQWGWITIRSTTIEFPLIAFLCAGLVLLILRGQYKEIPLVAGSVVLALLPAEGALRIIDHPLSRPYVDYVNWYEPSDLFGHQLVPNFEGFGPLNVPVKINSHGFRDAEHSWNKAPGTIRILGLGDSFLFGWGVKHEETFLKRLESLLTPVIGKSVETINSGVPGWGLNQYYLYLKTTGVRYAPDVVVLAYFLDDLNGAIQEAIPANEQYRRGLQFKGGILHHIRLYNFSKSLSDRIREKNRSKRIPYLHDQDARRAEWSQRPNYLMTEDPTGHDEAYERLFSDYLSRLKEIVEDHGAALVVMYIPDISQLYHPEVQRINRILAELTKAQDIPFVDMAPRFERTTALDTYYLWPKDPHTNAAGHLEMAKALMDVICNSVRTVSVACVTSMPQAASTWSEAE